MSGSNRYLLDTNVFIEAKNRYYSFDRCPGFWKSLISQHANGRVFSIDRVYNELTWEGDQLSGWVNDIAPSTFFKKTEDKAVRDMYGKMVSWVTAQPQFTPDAKAVFATLTEADAWVMAYAKANGHIVVTHEEYAAEAKNRVPMPNVMLEFEILWVNTFEMLDALDVQFVLRH